MWADSQMRKSSRKREEQILFYCAGGKSFRLHKHTELLGGIKSEAQVGQVKEQLKSDIE